MSDGYRRDVLVAGQWIAAADAIDVENPATEELIGTSAQATPEHVDAAVRAAREALPGWAHTDPAERGVALKALHAALDARRDALVECIVAEVGAPVALAAEAHVGMALDIVAYYAELAATVADEQVGNSLVLRRPAGVAACITPWNYPLYQLAAKVAPALAAGCTVVAKPAELTPLSAYLFADAAVQALPPGTVNLVPGTGTVTGAALVAHPGVDVVSFTGSTDVGRRVAAVAGAALKRVALELGGKSASLVLPDADLDAAVRATVASATYNSGQTCSAWTRLLVPQQRYGEALDLAAAHARGLVVGAPTDPGVDLGPLASAAQRERVTGYVSRAVASGARVVAGGVDRPDHLPRGHYVAPTVLADVRPDDEIAQHEVFGPVLVVLPYTDEDDAVGIANATPYGLAGAVWSADTAHAVATARRLDTGQVDVNGAPFNLAAPFGGWKASGIGRELGTHGLDEFVELTAVQL